MAGSYPDVPGPRMAYDRDGSVVVVHDGNNAPTVVGSNQLAGMNDEAVAGGDYAFPSGLSYVVVLFPQLRTLQGYGARFGDAGTYILQTSPDTTNGLDGTWTNQASGISNTTFSPAGASHRNNITALTVSSIKAVRFLVSGLSGDRIIHGIHLYGPYVVGQTPDRLAFTDTVDNLVGGAFFDWGDVPRGSSADKAFKLKNLSSTKTAATILVSVESLTDTTPSVASEHLLSLDGATFAATVTVSALAPGASQNLFLRRVTPSNATLSVWDARVVAAAGIFA